MIDRQELAEGILIASSVSEVEKSEVIALIINMTEKEVILHDVNISTEPLSEFEIVEIYSYVSNSADSAET